jgi:hypothetical protein
MGDKTLTKRSLSSDSDIEYFAQPVPVAAIPEVIEHRDWEWYEHLVSDVQAIITERLYRSRQEIIEGWWEVGQRITNDEHYRRYADGNVQALQKLANDLGRSLSALYYALQFFRQYPDLPAALDTFEEGKNISWKKITVLYLPAPKEPGEVDPPALDLSTYHSFFRAVMAVYNEQGNKPKWLTQMGEGLLQMEEDPIEGVDNFIKGLRALVGALVKMVYCRKI